MNSPLAPVLRDYLVRYQQMAIRETGHRPMTWLRTPMEESLLLPGCQKSGYSFWQPVEWKNDKAPVGKPEGFHQSIVDYLSMCQFYEICFELPVAASGSPLSFLHGRVFECCANTTEPPPQMLPAEAGDAFTAHAMTDAQPVELEVGLERLLPKVRFVYNI